MLVQNMTTVKTSSDGAWQGDNPLNYAFPLLIVQTVLVLFISRFVAFLLKPLRQPKVIAEIAGGILLGPSALGRNKSFMHFVFPSWSTPILESVASIGLLFFLFLVGLELDLTSIRRSGKRALSIALAGICLPFLFGIGVTFLLRKVIHVDHKVGYVQSIVFMGVALSITAFPVLARILAELKLLTTRVGETAMAAAAFNDVAAWILLALAVALAGGGGHPNPLVSIWVLISGVAFVGFMLVIVRPMMDWVVRKCSREHEVLDEAFICFTLAGVMLSGFMTDLIGIHSIFGAFVFGLTIPKGGEFAARLMKRIEDFVSGLLLPLYFASSGLKTDVAKLNGVEAWGLLFVVISTACAGKILGTFLVASFCMIPVRESLALGVLMNTKGLVELIVLNIGKEKKVLNDEMFTILVLMALFNTFLTTPTVMAIYKPAHGVPSQVRQTQLQQLPTPTDLKDQELRILACTHGPGNVASLINFIESIRTTKWCQLKLYAMHLVQLTDRSSSIMMVQRNRKNGFPYINRSRQGAIRDQIITAFEAYGQVSQVSVRHSTAISALTTMHEDICHVAEQKRAEMIILPFHKKWTRGDEEEAIESLGHDWREVNRKVLENASCSVAVLVNRGFDRSTEPTTTMPKRVCILFFGGPDDRKVLELGNRMAEHPTIRLTVMRFIENIEGKKAKPTQIYSLTMESTNLENEREMDEEAMAEFRMKWHSSMEYLEKEARSSAQEVLAIGKANAYDLIMAGKMPLASTSMAKMANNQAENAEFGPVGDLLSSSELGITSSVLIVQDQNVQKLARGKDKAIAQVIKEKELSV